ncbi:unnamed protein product, partial [Amoebophrya sp. A25]|eukprot:GSA25T00009040001.1
MCIEVVFHLLTFVARVCSVFCVLCCLLTEKNNSCHCRAGSPGPSSRDVRSKVQQVHQDVLTSFC